MDIKVCILSDYREDFKNIIKNLSLNNDAKFMTGGGQDDYVLSFEMRGFDDKVIECDYLLVINKIIKDSSIKTKRVIALQQEPYIKNSKQYALPFKNEWAIKKEVYYFCDIVFAFNEGLFSDDRDQKTFVYKQTKFIKYPPMMYFLFGNIPYKDLYNYKIPDKTKEISCIASFDKKAFPGHLDRIKFVKALKKSHIGDRIDFYGKNTSNELKEKKDGILPYKYTIAIENNSQSDYFSEKIMDAYLGYAIPIYFGADNIEEYFPKNSFIKIDIYNLQDSIKIIEDIINSNFYEDNFSALLEARRRVLEDYSMLNAIGKEIIKDYQANKDKPYKELNIKAYKRSLKDNIYRFYLIVYYGILKVLTNGEGKNRLKDL